MLRLRTPSGTAGSRQGKALPRSTRRASVAWRCARTHETKEFSIEKCASYDHDMCDDTAVVPTPSYHTLQRTKGLLCVAGVVGVGGVGVEANERERGRFLQFFLGDCRVTRGCA